jgi:hypothetical protein
MTLATNPYPVGHSKNLRRQRVVFRRAVTLSGKLRRALSLFFPTLLCLGALGIQDSTASPSSFSVTGSLVTARYNHTQTLLANNKVLVTGGADSNGTPFANAELYDPNAKSWSATGNLAVARLGHTATLLASGMVLVTGGQNQSGYLASAELYDPTTGVWTNTGNLSTPRAAHTATLLSSGKLLVAGGVNASGSLQGAETYDPTTGKWVFGGGTSARQRHTATLVSNSQSTMLLLAGGLNENGPLSNCEADELNGNGDALGGVGFLFSAIARTGHGATLLPNGKVLLTGGSNSSGFVASTELYDPTGQGRISTTGSIITARDSHTATLLPNGRVLVAGGRASSGTLASAELYDPTTGVWTATGGLIAARQLHSATLLRNGQVLVAGGLGASFNATATAELYDPASPDIPAQLQNISTRLNVLDNDNVLIGGFIITGGAAKKVMLRAIGPSLTQFGITGALADPTLELHYPDGSILRNDDWKINQQTGQSQELEIRATTIPPTNDMESALVQSLAPGAYTAIVRGKNASTGIGLVEAYDLDQSNPTKLANISTRGFVDSGNNVMIGGFIIGPTGDGNAKVVVRAIGPSLTNAGVANPLQDPVLELHDGNGGTIVSNDNWQDDVGAAEIRTDKLDPKDARESALLRSLPPGAYTAIVAGSGNTVGVGLVEVYNVQ